MAEVPRDSISVLAHDLRGSLTALLTTARLLELAPDDPQLAREAAAIIKRQVRWIQQRLEQEPGALPDVHQPGVDPPAPPAVQPADGNSLRVLVVDDDRAAAHLLCRLLEKLDCTVRAVGSAEEALRMLAEFSPAVVVTDQEMPGLHGDALARAILAREHPGGQGFPRPLLIALSGHDRPQVHDPSRSCFDHVLTKPADLAELERLLTEMRVRQP
jgi:CheY-like chemotaxis protein